MFGQRNINEQINTRLWHFVAFQEPHCVHKSGQSAPLNVSPSRLFSTGKPRVELTYDKMYTVTSRLTFTVSREDDGVPVVCIVDHPAVKDFQAQKYLEVQCK